MWWVHNHHLAKNTRFTGAVLAAAADGQPMILQIHDFPENARPANLARLHAEVSGSPYPGGDNVRYAVLNRRDHDALVAAGCPAERVVLLGNPVRPAAPVPAADAAPAHAARVRLAKAGAERLRSAAAASTPNVPVALSGARAAAQERAGGWPAGAARRSQPGRDPARSSTAETPYWQVVERLFADATIPGLCGVGERLDTHGLSFDDLLAAAHLIVSPSVEEGFGFQFVNALQWRRPLLARRLPVLDDLQTLLDGYPAAVYDAVHCPLSDAVRSTLRAALRPSRARAACGPSRCPARRA